MNKVQEVRAQLKKYQKSYLKELAVKEQIKITGNESKEELIRLITYKRTGC